MNEIDDATQTLKDAIDAVSAHANMLNAYLAGGCDLTDGRAADAALRCGKALIELEIVYRSLSGRPSV